MPSLATSRLSHAVRRMDLLNKLFDIARQRNRKIVLPEGDDERIIAAAARLAREKIASPILLGSAEEITRLAGQHDLSLAGIAIADPRSDTRLQSYGSALSRCRESMTPSMATRLVSKPIYFAGMMVREGHADAMVAGCADPTPSELADIAVTSARSAQTLLGETSRVAMLSFSTKGSAQHARVDKVREALSLVRQREPELAIDGEFQADAALVPTVAQKKVKDSSAVAGQANVLIFPDLDSGNIAYKLTQWLGGAQAIGPFLQGFAKPISDLSRGATIDDIVTTCAVVAAAG